MCQTSPHPLSHFLRSLALFISDNRCAAPAWIRLGASLFRNMRWLCAPAFDSMARAGHGMQLFGVAEYVFRDLRDAGGLIPAHLLTVAGCRCSGLPDRLTG